MRNPLWILNLSLLLIFLGSLLIIALIRIKPPARKSLAISVTPRLPKKSISSIDLSRIYENDLFKLYQKQPPPIKIPQVDTTFPPAPSPHPLPPIEAPRIEFLEPLKVTLKGIISSNDEKDNRAIIMDNKTKKEDIYALGDTIEDAEIIRIASNKVIFVRSNGQQETVFLNVAAASSDPIFTHDVSWATVVKKLSDFSYSVDPHALRKRVTSLAQFIDMLDITTALDNGISIGCRIGQISPESLGAALGFKYQDVILSINGMPISTTKDRVEVYHMLKKLPLESSIRLKLLRGDQTDETIEIVFILQSFDMDAASNSGLIPNNETRNNEMQNIPPKKIQSLDPLTTGTIASYDRSAMQRYGSRGSLLERTYQK
jgi:type II secretory pathway component PulC